MEDLLNLMLFYGFFLGVTLAAGHFFVKKEKKSRDFYTVSIFAMGLCLLNMALYSTRMIKYYEYYCTALLPVSYFAATTQYIRYRILITPVDRPAPNRWYYYIPSAAVLLFVLVPALHPALDYDPDLIRFYPLISPEFMQSGLYYKLLLALYPSLHLFHGTLFTISLAGASFIWSRKNSEISFVISKSLYICGFLICLASVFAFAGGIFSLGLVKAGTFIGSCSMLLTYIFAVRYPKFSVRLHEEVRSYGYMKSKVGGLDVRSIITKLENAMRLERAYAVEGITIRSMAAELGLTVHQLSEILNKHMGKNFNSYVNGFRIDEAKRLLAENPGMSIIQISGEVGFSSSSIFSTVFSKIEGISPREYRKKVVPGVK